MAQTKAQLLGPALGDVMDFDNNTFYIDGANNRVGILKNNPTVALEVNGTIKATTITSTNTTLPDWIVHEGDTNTKFGFSANDTFQVQTGGAARLTVTDSSTTAVGVINANAGVNITDNQYLNLGASNGSDARLWHDGSGGGHTYLFSYHSSGVLKIADDTNVVIGKTTNYNYINTTPTTVELFAGGNKKFETSSTGATVTGLLDVNGAAVNYPIKASGTANAKVLLTGANSPYIQWQEGTTNRAYAWWDSNNNRFELKNEQENSYIRIDSQINFFTTTSGSTYERLRIKNDGEVLIGTTTDRPIAGQRFSSGNGWGGSIQLERLNPTNGNNNVPFFAITAWNGANEQYTGGISFNRSNNNANGTHSAVNTNQQLGNIAFNGSDGTNFIQGAEIFAIPDQGFATNDGPTSLVFGTVPDGTSETRPQERLRIKGDGKIGVNESNPQNLFVMTQAHQGMVNDSAQPQATFLIKHGTSGSNRRWIGIGASTDIAWMQSSSPGGSGLAAPLVINPCGGNVGVGLMNPLIEFHVKGGGTCARFEGTGGNGFISLMDSDDSTQCFLGVDGGNFLLQTSGNSWATKLTVKTDGKVGIGKDITPTRNLHVQEHLVVANIGTNSGQPYVSTTPILAVTTDGSASFPGDTTYHNNAIVSFGVGGHNAGNPGSNALPGKEYFRLNLNGMCSIGEVDTTPNATLHLRSVSNNNTALILSSHDNYNGSYPDCLIKFTQQNGTELARIECDTNTSAANQAELAFFTNYGGLGKRVTIGKNGDVTLYKGGWLHNDQRMLTSGYFKTNTSSQTASNCPTLSGTSNMHYAFGYQEAFSTGSGSSLGGWVAPYPNLIVGYHTGMMIGAHPNYDGTRFYPDHPSANQTIIMAVGDNNSNVHVTNTFTAGTKTFRIAHPHPSKKYTHDLIHSVIEGPQCDNIYRGKIDLVGGTATVNIDTVSNMTDGTFVLLNRDIQCFTSNETGWTAVKGSVSGNVLTITAQDNSCTDTISWMVVGERQDDKIKSVDTTDENGKLIMEPLTIEETHM